VLQENSHARIESLWAYVGKFLISGWGVFDTKTQDVRLSKKATEFYVEVDKDGVVDLKVLRGDVEIETIASDQPPEGLSYSHGRSKGETLTVRKLQGLRIEKGKPLTTPRELKTDEVETVLTKTDKLMVASLATTPLNVIPTSYEVNAEFDRDPQRIKNAAETAFINARHRATLEPTAANIASLGHAYKDLGAGKSAVGEYEEAAKINPTLQNSVAFLAGQAEAYRLAGNLKKAAEKSDEAIRKSATSASNPFDKRLALNARGNVAYDLAVHQVAIGQWTTAGSYFKESKTLFESFKASEPDKKYSWIVDRNLYDVSRAISADPTLKPELSKFMGTHRGLVSFPAAGIEGPATIVISGGRFSLISCDETINGGITLGEPTANTLVFDVILDTSMPIKKLSLTASLPSDKRIEITSATGDNNRFSFTTTVQQNPLRCPRSYSVR